MSITNLEIDEHNLDQEWGCFYIEPVVEKWRLGYNINQGVSAGNYHYRVFESAEHAKTALATERNGGDWQKLQSRLGPSPVPDNLSELHWATRHKLPGLR